MERRAVVMWVLGVGGGIVLIAGVAAAQTPPVFRAARTFSLPGRIEEATGLVAIADVGRPPSGPPDGIPDLITAEQNLLAPVLFGKRDGTFSAGPNTNISTIPTGLAAADFDGDGFIDLLISATTSSVVFLRGSSEGPPWDPPGPSIDAGPVPAAVVAVDINKDGRMDALVVNAGSQGAGSLTVLIGNGDGTFSPIADPVATGRNSSAAAVGDFNRDGKLDVAVTDKDSDDVTIVRGDGTGGFTLAQTLAVGKEPVAVAARDLNGDGRLDLVVTNLSSDSIAVLNGKADGSFDAARFFASGNAGSSPNGLALADVNLDGDIDVVVPNNRSFDAAVLLGDGHGNFAAPRGFVADQEPLGVGTGDFDGDGVADVICVNRGGQAPTAAVLLSRVDGSLTGVENVVTGSNPLSVTAGDVDNDGMSDLISSHSDGSIDVVRADQAVGFAPLVSLRAAGDAVAVAQGDFNGDGRLDIVAVNQSTSNVSVFLARPQGGFASPQNYPVGSGPTAVTVGDWNGDGRPDLAVVRQVARQGSAANGAVDILLGAANGTFGSATSVEVGVTPVAIDKGDFNKDGKLDLAVVNNVSGDVSILLGNGNGTFAATPAVSVPGGPRGLAIADFDRDGFDDVAVVLSVSRSAVVLYGPSPFVSGPSISVENSPSAIAARDINGDMIPDLLIADQVSNSVLAFVRAPAPTTRQFQRSQTVIVNRQPISLAEADFDGDGRYDGAAADSSPAATVSVLTNILAPAVLRGDANGDTRVSAADTLAVIRELSDGRGTRIEDINVGGTYAAAAGVDANGDGVVTPQDALAVAHRIFVR